MNSKDIISFLAGLILAGLVYGSLLFLNILVTFSFAGERLTVKENREAFYFYASLMILLAAGRIIVKRYKAGKKALALGISLPSLVVVYAFAVFGLTYIDNLNYRQPFNKEKWNAAENKPFRMAKTLVKYKVLDNMSPGQVIKLLGDDGSFHQYENRASIFYETDKFNWELRLIFENDKLVEAYIYEEGLCL